jgi:hypothetical protein
MGNTIPATNQLHALLNELNAIVASGRGTANDVAPLSSMIQGLIDSLS